VFFPLVVGLLTQTIAKKKYGVKAWNETIKPKFPPFSALGVVLIAFVAMSLKARHIIANPGDIFIILLPLAVFYLVSYALLTVAGRLLFQREDAIAMVFGVVMRDLSIALAIAMTAFGKEGLTIALLISLAYIIQIQSAAWYVKFINVMFGPPKPVKTDFQSEQDVPDEPVEITGSMVMDIKKILFATDLSPTARHAVKYACAIGNKFNADVYAVHVVPDILDDYSTGTGVNLAGTMNQQEREALNRDKIEAAKKAMHKRMRVTSQKVLSEIPHCPLSENRIIVTAGDPVDEITRIAAKDHFDLIIMGTHGHGEFGKIMLGSTASGVMSKSRIPVLVARPA
jgi:nucleotide-binding universal stress UspA family protein